MSKNLQTQKRARQSIVRNRKNSSMRSMLRTAVKHVHAAVNTGEIKKANELFQKATSIIDRVADKNVIHKNKAARQKRRLSHLIKSAVLV
ncbi:MAG: 30S ribosomal protein S20 [Bordetella sp.]|nr:MAG: 30S ribosomal protein S20 [Bordetella sp.]